jgi:hypothetical protein
MEPKGGGNKRRCHICEQPIDTEVGMVLLPCHYTATEESLEIRMAGDPQAFFCTACSIVMITIGGRIIRKDIEDFAKRMVKKAEGEKPATNN